MPFLQNTSGRLLLKNDWEEQYKTKDSDCNIGNNIEDDNNEEYSEAVARSCSVKKVLLEISQTS